MINKEIDYKANSFDIIRLIAAFQVMFGHFVQHFELDVNSKYFRLAEFLSRYIPGKGVIIFFVICGFFSVSSVEKCDCSKGQSGGGYYKKKFLRLYPELWLAFIVNTILIISLYGLSTVKNTIIYFITQLTFFQFYTGEWLRGYGVGTPNGALWTITVTIQFYVFIFFLQKITKTWKFINWVMLLLIGILIAVVCSNLSFLPEIILKLIQMSLIPYFYIFCIGIIVYKYKEIFLPFLKKWCFIIGLIYLIVKVFITNVISPINWGMLYDVWSTCLLSFSILGIGYALGKHRLKHEISYSIFLWHMIICNVTIEIAERRDILLSEYGSVFLFGSILVTIVLAFLSTNFEKHIITVIEKK